MMVIALTMIIACNGVLTYQRNKVWKDESTLWDDTVRKSPHKARAYNNRGVAFAHKKKDDFTQAISDFSKAIELDPSFAGAYYDRAVSYYQLKEYNKAWADVHRAEELGSVVDSNLISALKKASGKDR